MFGPPFAPSVERSVDHIANTISRKGRAFRSSIAWLADRDLWSDEVTVGHSAITIFRMATCPALLPPSLYDAVALLFAVSVGHKPISIPEMVRATARGFDRHCPHGVSQGLQITPHETEPVSRARNLLSKDN